MMLDKPWYRCEPGAPCGPGLARLMKIAYSSCARENDHFPLLVLGGTNSGKSNLGLWIYEQIHPTPEIWRVVWTKDEFAKVQAKVAREPMPRVVFYDELDAESKEAMSRWNRDLKRLFDKVRYSNIFWILINPSANYIDKSFVVDEVIKGVIVIRDKHKNRPREVIYYTLEGLRKLLEHEIGLTLSNLTNLKIASKYGELRSWFRKYTGLLASEYELKKEHRVLDIHEAFSENYSEGRAYKLAVACKQLEIGPGVGRKELRAMVDEGVVKLEDIMTPTGQYRFGAEVYEKLRLRVIESDARLSFNKPSEG